MGVNEQIHEIAERIMYLRDAIGLTQEEVAEKIGVSLDDYRKYEIGQTDIPISVIYSTAGVLGVDATELLAGVSPRMLDYCVTRKGQGIAILRHEGYEFEALATNFKGRDKEPMIVTLSPADKNPRLLVHGGQEFNYVLEGKIGVILGDKIVELSAGDSIYFLASIPHGQIAYGSNAKFLTIIEKE
ncbi:MAG: cupin domain-containing protein [Clostridia bacterium]|nr:cupin domain-containing protein [Clostridia bacterium]